MSNNRKTQQKPNKVNAFYNKIDTKKYSILEQFQLFLKETPTARDIVGFLSVQNARLLTHMVGGVENLPEEKAKEVYEFFLYFMKNFNEITYEARFENWSDDALILRVGMIIDDEIAKMEEEQFLNSLTDKQKLEAQTLADTIMAIRKNRHISCITPEDMWSINIPKTIRRNELESYKRDLYIACAEIVEAFGAMTVRLSEPEKNDEIFGIRVIYPFQVWSPISKEEMLDAHTLAPDGIRIAPEEGVVYTEIMRERF